MICALEHRVLHSVLSVSRFIADEDPLFHKGFLERIPNRGSRRVSIDKPNLTKDIRQQRQHQKRNGQTVDLLESKHVRARHKHNTTNQCLSKFVESLSTMVGGTLNASRRSTFSSAHKRTQIKWSRTVQTPGKRDGETSKNNFTYLQDFHGSATLEETFLEGCLKQNQSRTMRIRNTHGFLLKRQPPVCQRIPVATTDRSGWTQCQAEKTGSRQRVGKTTKKEEQTLKETLNTWHNIVEASVDNTWQISPLCHLL